MRLELTGIPLDGDAARILRQRLGEDRSSPCIEALVQHVVALGATYALLEDPYTDIDYSADYQAVYAGAFKSYPRQTKRLHLFTRDVSSEFEGAIEAASALMPESYLGFVVVRPIVQGPVGRTVLAFPQFSDLIVRRGARATFRSHVAWRELAITGAPFIQQEQKVGACAQAAIWMAGLAVHSRHRTPRATMADITRMATTPTDAVVSQALPAGSDGLNPMHMIRALRGMGHQPLFDVLRTPTGTLEPPAPPAPADDPRPSPAAKILRYLDSGLPVILNLDTVMHVVTAIGYVEVPGAAVREGATYDVFARALLVHDDQSGPYRLMPLGPADAEHLPQDRLLQIRGGTITVSGDAAYMFVPLPSRVTLSADRADVVAMDFLRKQAKLDEIPRAFETDDPAAAHEIASFFQKVSEGRIVRRTYLTSAARYRHHLAKSDLAPEVKVELLPRTLPHYIWVTELLERDSPPDQKQGPRRILGHIVVNATSTSDPDNDLLMAHTPHLVTHRDLDSTDPLQEFPSTFVETDQPYRGRIRS